MSSLGSPNSFFLAGKKAYEVERSIRNDQGTADVNNGSNFEHTYSSAGNQKTFTISVWVKKCNTPGNIGDDGYSIFSTGGGGSGAQQGNLYFPTDDTLYFVSQPQPSPNAFLITNRIFRDFSAWCHIVIKVDTTQSTASNRLKMYINGIQETSFSTETYPSQNADLQFNQAVRHRIGSNSLGSNLNHTYANFNGYIAEFNFLDGYAYDPSYFGETDAVTGQWNPKKYVGSYGTNGFYLNFSDNSGTTATTLGKDSSGNSNNFTPNNFSVSAGVGNDSLEDTPTNNFCTLNPLDVYGDGVSEQIKNGNLEAKNTSGSYRMTRSTFHFTTGKWYWEVKVLNAGSATLIGVAGKDYAAGSGARRVYNSVNGQKYIGNGSSYGASFTTNDIIGVALDLDNGTLTFYKNGSSQGVAFTDLLTAMVDGGWTPVFNGYGNSEGAFNFGQRAFSYTPPTGFKKLNSANLPDPTIKLPNKHFDTLLWTGTAASHTLTGLNFKPDWFWAKSRSQGYHHTLIDSVRGTNKQLWANRNNDEQTSTSFLTSFNSNGVTLGDNSSGTGATNTNGHTYVGWNWNAGDTDGKTYTVKVVSDGGNKYRFDDFGTSAVTLDLAEGGSYVFDLSDSSNDGHPMKFSTTANGSHGGGSTYSTGVTYELDGVSKTESEYVSGFNSASSRLLKITVAASAPNLNYFCHYHSGMGGAINTNSTLGSSNFDGGIQAVVKANPTAGFSIVTYTGTGSQTTVGHGLGVKPKFIITKLRSGSQDWMLYPKQITGNGATYIKLNTSDGVASDAHTYPNVEPTSTVYTVGGDDGGDGTNGNNKTYVAYVFSEVANYSKFGIYKGNGATNGSFVFTDFAPSMVWYWKLSGENRHILDTSRDPLNPNTLGIDINLSNAEANDSNLAMDFLSNGFKLRTSHSTGNSSGVDYIYFAFAEAPFRNARAR